MYSRICPTTTKSPRNHKPLASPSNHSRAPRQSHPEKKRGWTKPVHQNENAPPKTLPRVPTTIPANPSLEQKTPQALGPDAGGSNRYDAVPRDSRGRQQEAVCSLKRDVSPRNPHQRRKGDLEDGRPSFVLVQDRSQLEGRDKDKKNHSTTGKEIVKHSGTNPDLRGRDKDLAAKDRAKARNADRSNSSSRLSIECLIIHQNSGDEEYSRSPHRSRSASEIFDDGDRFGDVEEVRARTECGISDDDSTYGSGGEDYGGGRDSGVKPAAEYHNADPGALTVEDVAGPPLSCLHAISSDKFDAIDLKTGCHDPDFPPGNEDTKAIGTPTIDNESANLGDFVDGRRSAKNVTCEEMGYFAEDCETPRPGRACHNCGSTDHIMRDCPEPKIQASLSKRSSNQYRANYTPGDIEPFPVFHPAIGSDEKEEQRLRDPLAALCGEPGFEPGLGHHDGWSGGGFELTREPHDVLQDVRVASSTEELASLTELPFVSKGLDASGSGVCVGTMFREGREFTTYPFQDTCPLGYDEISEPEETPVVITEGSELNMPQANEVPSCLAPDMSLPRSSCYPTVPLHGKRKCRTQPTKEHVPKRPKKFTANDLEDSSASGETPSIGLKEEFFGVGAAPLVEGNNASVSEKTLAPKKRRLPDCQDATRPAECRKSEYTQFSDGTNKQIAHTQTSGETVDSDQPFRFLDLPFEMRTNVYNALFKPGPRPSQDDEVEVYEDTLQTSERDRPPHLTIFGEIPNQLQLRPIGSQPPGNAPVLGPVQPHAAPLNASNTVPGQALVVNAPPPPAPAPPLVQQGHQAIAAAINPGAAISRHHASKILKLRTAPKWKQDLYFPGVSRLSIALPYCRYAEYHDTHWSFDASRNERFPDGEQHENLGVRRISDLTYESIRRRIEEGGEGNPHVQLRLEGPEDPIDSRSLIVRGQEQYSQGDDSNGANLLHGPTGFDLNVPGASSSRYNFDGSGSSSGRENPDGRQPSSVRKRSISNRTKLAILQACTATYTEAKQILHENRTIYLHMDKITRRYSSRDKQTELLTYLEEAFFSKARNLHLTVVLMPRELRTRKKGSMDYWNLQNLMRAYLEYRRKHKTRRHHLQVEITIACEPSQDEKSIFSTALPVFQYQEKPGVDFEIRIAASLTCEPLAMMIPFVHDYRTMLDKAVAGFRKIKVPARIVDITNEPWF